MIELISEKTREQIEELFEKVESSIYIVSPFLSVKTAEILSNLCKEKEIDCTLITRIYLKDLLDGVNSIKALRLLLETGVEVYALKALHAKLYMFDKSSVILGSANFTLAGLGKNFELSVLTDELSIVEKAEIVVEDLIIHCTDNDGSVTEDMLKKIEEAYEKAYKSFHKHGNIPLTMFGAERKIVGVMKKDDKWQKEDLQIEDEDPIFELFAENKVKKTNLKKNIWAKFEGKGDDRQSGEELPSLSKVVLDGEEKYIVNFRNRPQSIETGDRLYILAYTFDRDGNPAINIVGRGKAIARIHKNEVQPEWIKEYPWMEYYHYFCEVEDVELLNLPRKECISLEQVHDALGKRTYVTTLEKDEIKNLSLVRCRKSHLRLTFDAMEYIDNEIDKLANQYGFIENIGVRRK